jgi:hypothetical protein
MKRAIKESDLYPKLSKWLRTSYGCFATSQNLGLQHSRVDVLGIRDVGGDLSGEVETIGVEVKRGNQPFATTSGQARGYSVYADRVYLADVRTDGFTRHELDIASALGVGLIRISSSGCREVLSSPRHKPIARMQLRVFEKMGYGRCCVCQCLFQVGKGKADYDFSHLSRAGIVKAAQRDKGLIFWNEAVGKRKVPEGRKKGISWERRFVCRECVQNLFPIHQT